eukprot:gene748-10468_t
MAHQSNDPPYNQLGDTGVFVVNQQPQLRRQFQFPIRFQSGPVLAVSIVKCIIGSLQFLFGIINIIFVPFFTSYVAFPIWCGLLSYMMSSLSFLGLLSESLVSAIKLFWPMAFDLFSTTPVVISFALLPGSDRRFLRKSPPLVRAL